MRKAGFIVVLPLLVSMLSFSRWFFREKQLNGLEGEVDGWYLDMRLKKLILSGDKGESFFCENG